MDRREYVCNQMYKQHDLLRKGSWTDADKLEYMELNIAPYSRYWRMGMKKALKHAIRLLREEEAKAERKTENNSEKPNNCETCKHNKLEWYSEVCDGCSKAHSHYEPKDEPQTEKGGCTNCAGKDLCKNAFTEISQYCGAYEPQTERSE